MTTLIPCGRTTSPGRPPDARKDEQILCAARSLLLQGGPAALTMDAVARASGVSKATLYRRWPHREALLEALIDREATQLVATLSGPALRCGQLRLALTRFLNQLLVFVTQPPYQAYLRALATLPQRPEDLQFIWRLGPQQVIDALAALLRRHAEIHQVYGSKVERDAEVLLGMAIGLEWVRILYGQPPQWGSERARRRHVRYVVDWFLRQISCDGKTKR